MPVENRSKGNRRFSLPSRNTMRRTETRSPSILAVNPLIGNPFADPVDPCHAGGCAKTDFRLILLVGVVGTPEIQLQSPPGEGSPSARHRPSSEISPIFPLVGVGQSRDEDRKKVHLGIDIFPGR